MYICEANHQDYFDMAKSSNISDKTFPLIYCIVFLCLTFYYMPMKNGYYLRWIDGWNFFDSSSFEFSHLLNYPGGLLQYSGSFLTQLFYYPWLGTASLVLLWSMIIVLLVSTFKLKGYAVGMAFIVPACLLNGILGLDENLFVLYSKGVAFSPTLGFLFTVVCLWTVSRLKALPSGIIAILLPLLYPIMGFYALLSCILCALMTANSKKSAWIPIVGVIFIVIIPRLYYVFWHGTWVDSENMYLKGLPDFIVEKCDFMLWLPYIIIVFLLSMQCAVSRFFHLSEKVVGVASAVLFIAVMFWGGRLSSKPEPLRAMIMMQQSMDENNWDRVVRLASNLRETPTPDIVTIAKLASQKTGKGIPMYTAVKEELRNHPRLQSSVVSTALISVPVSYYIGQPNLGYRWAMEHSIKYGKNVFLLKYLVRCALASGDVRLAQKYNSMLGKTLFHQAWSEHYQAFIDNPELMKEDDEFKLIPSRTQKEVFF